MAESLGLTTDTFSFDNLISGAFPIVARSITLASGENLEKGTLIGKITRSTPTTGTKTGTGNGTMTGVLGGRETKIGIYKAICIDASISGSEIFAVYDPDGVRLEDATVGVAYSNNHISFTINDGTTDFIVGDYFTVTVAAGSGYYKKALLAAVDGSGNYENMAILAKDTDASSANIVTTAWITGQYNENQVTFGTGLTFANTKDELKKYSIFLEESSEN